MKIKNSYTNSVEWLSTILCICLTMLMTTIAQAQLLTTNNVVIVNSTQVTVKGDIQSNAGTVISNTGGIIDLTGNWTNNSGNNIFGTSTGAVILNGANQLINGANSTLFNNLNLINGIKTLEINTTVGGGNIAPAGVLNCNNAVLDLNSNTLTVNNASGAAITTTTGYVLSEDFDNSSKVVWKIATTTGIHTIPFGNAAGIQIPFSYNLTSGDAGNVSVSTYATAANNTPLPVAPTVVTHVRDMAGLDNSANTVDRFWQVDKTGITGIANYTFTYAPSENAATGNINVRAQYWNTSNVGWDAAQAGQSNPTSQSVIVPAVTMSGAWALSLSASPLPVELLQFSAIAKDNNKVICNWATASEINNDYFTIERSLDGITFVVVGNIDGTGTTNIQHSYSLTDSDPYIGVSYYRLKQTDYNGDHMYSKIETVLISNHEIKYLVYPNPNKGNFMIQFNPNENTSAEYLITDATGRIIQQRLLNNATGMQNILLENVTAGIYFLQITNGDKTFLSKLQVM